MISFHLRHFPGVEVPKIVFDYEPAKDDLSEASLEAGATKEVEKVKKAKNKKSNRKYVYKPIQEKKSVPVNENVDLDY